MEEPLDVILVEARMEEERDEREEQAGERPALRVVVRVISRRMVMPDGGGKGRRERGAGQAESGDESRSGA